MSNTESNVLLANVEHTNKRKGENPHEIICKDHADTMEKIDGNDPEMIKMSKNQFNEMSEEVMKNTSSKNANTSKSFN